MGAGKMFDDALDDDPGDLEILQHLVWRITDLPPDIHGWPVLGEEVAISADELDALNRALDSRS